MYVYFDLEADELRDKATKIHVVSFRRGLERLTTNKPIDVYNYLEEVENNGDIIVGHNIIGYDFPVLRKLWEIDYKGDRLDTLVLSKLTNPDRKRHSLEFLVSEAYHRFGITPPEGQAKVAIEDWVGDTYDNYVHRCEVDVDLTEFVHMFLIEGRRFDSPTVNRSMWL